MNILSIQSHVAYGYVGNSAAAFPLRRLGHEVWAVNTVMFSNHTGYGAWRGPVFEADAVADVIAGMSERKVLADCHAVLSGYMGDAALGEVILDTAARVKQGNGDALYACDPVMGDVGRGIFVRDGIPEFMRDRAVPAADIITPNQFELELLTGVAVNSLDSALKGAAKARALGPDVVVITSLVRPDARSDRIEMLASTADGAWLVSTPKLALDPPPNGAGDVTAALFLAHYLEKRFARRALERTAAAVYALFEATQAAGRRELALIAAQDKMVKPPRTFAASQVA